MESSTPFETSEPDAVAATSSPKEQKKKKKQQKGKKSSKKRSSVTPIKKKKKKKKKKQENPPLDQKVYQHELERLQELWSTAEASSSAGGVGTSSPLAFTCWVDGIRAKQPACWMGYFRSNETLKSSLRQLTVTLCSDGVLEGTSRPVLNGVADDQSPSSSMLIGRWCPSQQKKKKKKKKSSTQVQNSPATTIELGWVQIDPGVSMTVAVGKIMIFAGSPATTMTLSGDFASFAYFGPLYDTRAKKRGFFSFQPGQNQTSAATVTSNSSSQVPQKQPSSALEGNVRDPELGFTIADETQSSSITLPASQCSFFASSYAPPGSSSPPPSAAAATTMSPLYPKWFRYAPVVALPVMVLLIIIICASIYAPQRSNNGSDDYSLSATQEPTELDDDSPYGPSIADAMSIMCQVSSAARRSPCNEDQFGSESPQKRSALQLVEKVGHYRWSSMGDNVQQREMKQRYILGVLYYQTGGSDWYRDPNFFRWGFLCDFGHSYMFKCDIYGQITELDLSWNNLVGELDMSAELSQLESLVSLNLYGNPGLSQVP